MKDVNEIIEEVGMGRSQVLQLLPGAMLFLIDGGEILLAASVLASLEEVWGISAEMKGLMMSGIFIGALFGNALGGILADSLGRRRMILVSLVGCVTLGLLSAAATGPMMLLCCRVTFGCFFGIGVCPVLTLAVEISPADLRGHTVNALTVLFALGEVFVAVLLVIFMPDIKGPEAAKNWRHVTVLSVIPGLVMIPVGLIWLQESPRFLVANGRQEEAVEVLRRMAASNGKEDLARDLREVAPAETPVEPDSGSSGTSSTLASTASGGGGAEGSLSHRFAVMFGPDYRLITLGGCYLTFVVNFLFYGLTYALPLIFSSIDVPLSPAVQVLFVAFCDLPGVFLAFWLIQQKDFGHRDALVALAGVAAVLMLSLVALDFGKDYLMLALSSTYLAKFVSAAFLTLVHVYIAEIFPSECRATALAICTCVGRLGSILSPPIYEASTSAGHHAGFVCLTSLLCALAAAAVRGLLGFELKNEPLEDVHHTAKQSSKKALVEDSGEPATAS